MVVGLCASRQHLEHFFGGPGHNIGAVLCPCSVVHVIGGFGTAAICEESWFSLNFAYEDVARAVAFHVGGSKI